MSLVRVYSEKTTNFELSDSSMRLNNTSRLHQIIHLGLSEPVFRESKKLLAIGEKLKETEQSLVFLLRCKQEQIFPVFILQTIKAPDWTFPIKFSNYHQKKLQELRLSCLNQHIQFKFTLIEQLKQDSHSIRSFLRDSEPHSYDDIIRIYFSNNNETKIDAKNRLLNKFNWLLYKYYLPAGTMENTTTNTTPTSTYIISSRGES